MDFSLSDELQALRAEVRRLVDDHVIPAESQIVAEDTDGRDDTLQGLRDLARAAGLWTPHLPPEHGGRGLGVLGMAVLFRGMGRSLVGPSVFGCDAPDQGNMALLVTSASPLIQSRYLAPLCAGEITSAFCMTEPAPGAGASPERDPPKVAFLFLVGGDVATEPLWRSFFATDFASRRASIHVHPPRGYLFPEGSFFEDKAVPQDDRYEVTWASLAMVHAELVLIAHALKDPRNERFVLLSETDVPLWPFEAT